MKYVLLQLSLILSLFSLSQGTKSLKEEVCSGDTIRIDLKFQMNELLQGELTCSNCDSLVYFMMEYSACEIELIGQTNLKSNTDFNRGLAFDRMNYVHNYLNWLGIDSSRITLGLVNQSTLNKDRTLIRITHDHIHFEKNYGLFEGNHIARHRSVNLKFLNRNPGNLTRWEQEDNLRMRDSLASFLRENPGLQVKLQFGSSWSVNEIGELLESLSFENGLDLAQIYEAPYNEFIEGSSVVFSIRRYCPRIRID